MPVNIRRARYDDVETILAWSNNRAIWMVDNPADYQPRSLAEFKPQWQTLVDHGTTWVIELEGVAVGHLGWIQHAPEICEFYIILGEPSALGRGIGREAMTWMLYEARARGLDVLYGRVLGNNPHALRFFNRLGFELIGRSEQYFERGGIAHDLLWLQADLSGFATERSA